MRKQLGIFLLVLTIALGFSGAVTASESSSKTMMNSNSAQIHMTPGQMTQMMKKMHMSHSQMIQMCMKMMYMMKKMHITGSQMKQMMQIMLGKNMRTTTHRHTR